jgi:uncharacterized OsmC-like protein
MNELNQGINGINIEPLLRLKSRALEDPSCADRRPTVTAHWVGGDEASIEQNGIVTYLGGDNNLNPMGMLLGVLAACDIVVIAMHCSFLGLRIESLSIEVTGEYNSSALLGIADVPGSGYNRIEYTVYLKAPDATLEQIEHLKELCERSSPVGDTLTRAIPIQLEFVAA